MYPQKTVDLLSFRLLLLNVQHTIVKCTTYYCVVYNTLLLNVQHTIV